MEYTSGNVQVGVMVWGAFMGRQKGPLVQLKSDTITSRDYVKMFREHVLNWIRQ